MLRCIIVDDEQNALDVLRMHIEETGNLELVYATTKPLDALNVINDQDIDLAFVDIQMPGITGLDLAKVVQGKCRVIFTTAYSHFVTDAYELDVLDYLLKPIPLPRFMKAVQRAYNIIAPSQEVNIDQDNIEYDYFFVKTEQKGKMIKISLTDIDYIEGMKKYVAIHHCGRKTLALINMKDIEERLPSKYFMRVQKSFIVARHKIAMVEGNILKLNNLPTEITIGETYKAQFVESMKWKVLQ